MRACRLVFPGCVVTYLNFDSLSMRDAINNLDCKTVRIFVYSSKREQSNERSGMRLKMPRFTDFLTDFEKKNPTVLQSINNLNFENSLVNRHFRVPLGLCIKTRLSAQPLI